MPPRKRAQLVVAADGTSGDERDAPSSSDSGSDDDEDDASEVEDASDADDGDEGAEASSGDDETQARDAARGRRRSSGSGGGGGGGAGSGGAKRAKPISVSLKKREKGVCHVCGQKGHQAGFQGAVYVDCINRPCFLCKTPGHTTATCPHRVEPGFGVAAEKVAGAAASAPALLLNCETTGRRLSGRELPCSFGRWQVDAAILKLHTRRVTALAFPPDSDALVVSGDKKGGVAVWSFDEVHDRTVHNSIFAGGPLNAIRFAPWASPYTCAGAGADGTVRLFDIDTAQHTELLNLNPGGWHKGVRWEMVYGLDACGGASGHDACALLAGDSEGRLHVLDPRAHAGTANASTAGGGGGGGGCGVAVAQVHKTKTRICSVSVQPLGQPKVMTAGNDHTVRILDLRKLSNHFGGAPGPSAAGGSSGAGAPEAPDPPAAGGAGRGRGRGRGGAAGGGRGRGGGSGGGRGGKGGGVAHASQVALLQHKSVINAAYYSPVTGRKILTTCQDNRLRVWDLYLSAETGAPPDREIVHSHDFNRYLTPFKAEWDPKDRTERLVVCGRYISEEYGGQALHPIDVIDASSGRTLRSLVDGNLTTISPVAAFHPRRDIIITGSSRSLYCWRPSSADAADGADAGGAGFGGGGSGGLGWDGGSGDDDSDGGGGGGGGGGRRAGVSSSYVFFDADPGSAKKKAGPGGRGGRGGGKGRAGGKRKAAEFEEGGDDSDDDD